MPRRIGLGRGLAALLENDKEEQLATPEQVFKQSLIDAELPVTAPAEADAAAGASAKNNVVQIPINKLVTNPGQPRKNFDKTELDELAASIKTYGIIQPVIAANSHPDGSAGDGTYIIIAGERRTRAAKLAGLKAVPVIIRDYTDQKRLEISLIENIQRTDLNPIEEAAAYKNLMDFSGLSQDDLAVRVGKNRSTVANALRLLKLPVEMQKSIEEGTVSPGHARALLSVNDTRAREKLFREILSGAISVREAEKRASSSTEKKEKTTAKKSSSKRPPEVDAMVEKFISKLGTKVVIDGDLNKGRILIDYYSMEDLERLYEILSG